LMSTALYRLVESCMHFVAGVLGWGACLACTIVQSRLRSSAPLTLNLCTNSHSDFSSRVRDKTAK
jgi:hypothetical protein